MADHLVHRPAVTRVGDPNEPPFSRERVEDAGKKLLPSYVSIVRAHAVRQWVARNLKTAVGSVEY